MDNRIIFTKTAKGLSETLGKTKALSRESRKILKEVDGKITLGEIIDKLDDISPAKVQVAMTKMLADDFIREFASAPQEQNSQQSMGDSIFGITSPAPLENALSQFTIGDFMRAMEDLSSDEKGEAGDLSFKSLPEEPAPEQKAHAEEVLRKAQAAREQAEAEQRAAAEAMAQQQRIVEERARKEAEQQARIAAQEKARQEAEEKARREAEAMARRKAEEKAAQEAKANEWSETIGMAGVEAGLERARQEAEARAHRQAEEQAQREQAERLREEQEARARRLAIEEQRRKMEERVIQELQDQVGRDAEAKARQDVEESARRQVEAQARRKAEEDAMHLAQQRARELAEEQARQDAEEKARKAAAENARKEAEEKARREAEAKAKQEAEEQARQKAWEAVRLATEAQAKKEAEARAKQEAEEKARQEAEEKARRKGEEKAKKEAEAQARREAEEKARREAEEQARLKAEEKARKAAEEKVKKEAEAKARREAEETARRAAEEQARLKAEEKARKAAEEKARKEAEAEAKRQAKEKARQEAEQQARQKAEEKARKEAEDKARREVEDKARQEAEEMARREAEARAKVAAEEKARRAAEEEARHAAENAQRQAAAEQARREAEERARLAAEEKARQQAEKQAAIASGERVGIQPVKLAAVGALVLVLLLGVAALALQFVSFDSRIPQLETAAAEQFGHPVKIKKLKFTLLPSPGWRLEDVIIGDAAQVGVHRISAAGGIGSLFGGGIDFNAITLESPVVTEEGLGWLLFGRPGKTGFAVSRISATHATLKSQQIVLPAFDLRAEIGEDGNWQKMTIAATQEKLHLEMQPKGGELQLEMNAESFTLPFGGKMVLEKFNASGSVTRNSLSLREFQGIAYDGVVKGNARLNWSGGWSLNGDLTVRTLDPARLAPALFQSGSLEADMRYGMQAGEAGKLLASPHAKGTFTVSNGALAGVDLAGLLLGQSGDKTSFNSLGGEYAFEDGRLQLRRVQLAAGLMSATGSADLDGEGRLGGRFALDFKSAGRQMRGNLNLGGTLKEPRFSR